ncbi:Homeodomain-like DNA binding domain-containing transcription factor [Phycomyces blakesleeanus NRRL 1555(-)]|uniref:Homeodomain-like DNA binding domain-containing transcription factor n=1 Tax=Phycomyces blakesleeanus (strain ATCC 8743b / DSM 1359 / FGSC 10004 / NBRC 33097 / NRRL 1555) TaxID=763407 RepID=A0A163A2T5_PHYB8|nr:Homeodomain-like DNA binding domain-containing transcription factor [Phycomyces blakesleeanus NRRL 1555(-)]OAD70671.1 Homeodomain-like DNA binding domain-containing transcription factor [Phycomyces blakesleeanus NRRL 1555(-)]|eukprot:XP_018288711.1 Homeodomain-like DNA binding domain-containing transcription factor [Phycomyces blakesleeanus NRRL 1555(-)]
MWVKQLLRMINEISALTHSCLDIQTRFTKIVIHFRNQLPNRISWHELGIHVRAAQRWVKRYYEDPGSIFEKKRKSSRRRILGEDHKQFLLNYIDENPSALVIEVTESLTQIFAGLNASRSTIYSFMATERNLSIKQAQFQPVERNSEEKIQQRYHWVQKWQQTDLDFTTN